jgi:hypothetical protein
MKIKKNTELTRNKAANTIIPARASTELMTTAVIPTAPVPIAINVLTPPAMPDFESFPVSKQHPTIAPRMKGVMAMMHSIKHKLAIIPI